MTSLTFCASTATTTSPIAASSSRQGMIAETTGGWLTSSQAPAQATIGTSFRRLVRKKCYAKIPIRRSVPDLRQGLPPRVTERIVVVTVLRKRRDAARQSAAIGRKIHQRPRPPAERPGGTVAAPLQAQARFARRTRCAEGDTKRTRQLFRLFQISRFLLCQLFEQRLIRLRLADRRL